MKIEMWIAMVVCGGGGSSTVTSLKNINKISIHQLYEEKSKRNIKHVRLDGCDILHVSVCMSHKVAGPRGVNGDKSTLRLGPCFKIKKM